MSLSKASSSPAGIPAAAALDRSIWTVLGVAVGTQTAGSFVSQGVYILVPFWRDAFGVSLAAASLAVTAMNGAQIATLFAMGKAIDRHGERGVVALAMVAMGLAMAGAALFASGLPTLLVAIACLGGVYAAVQPGGTKAIMAWFPPHRRGLATGFRQAAVPLGTAMAAFALPLLVARHGWQAAVCAQALVALAGGALFWLCYREKAGDGAASASIGALPLPELLRQLGHNRDFWPLLIAGIAMSAFQFTLTAHAIGYMANGLGLGMLLAGSLFAGTQVLGIPGRILLPWLSDRWFPGLRIRCLGGIMLVAAAAAIAFLLLPPQAPLPAVIAVLLVIGLFGVGWLPLYILQIAEMAPKSSIASTVSFASTLCMIVMALGPFLFGLAVDALGYRVAWTMLALPVVLTALPLLRAQGAR